MGDVCGDDPVVLVVTTGDSVGTTVDAAVTESRFADCERVGSLAELVDRVGPGSGVGCVLVTEFVEDPETLVERCREVDRDVPIVVANDEPSLEELREVLLEGSTGRVERVTVEGTGTDGGPGVEGAGTDGGFGTLVAGRDDVGCVLVGDDGEYDPVAACEDVRSATELVPVIAGTTAGSERLAHRFTAAGGDEYVPRSVGLETVRKAVDGAIAAYERRRDEHAQSEMFDSLLANVSLPLYAKDDSGRYVKHSVVPADRDPEDVIGKTDPEIYDADPGAARGWLEDDLSVVETGDGVFDNVSVRRLAAD